MQAWWPRVYFQAIGGLYASSSRLPDADSARLEPTSSFVGHRFRRFSLLRQTLSRVYNLTDSSQPHGRSITRTATEFVFCSLPNNSFPENDRIRLYAIVPFVLVARVSLMCVCVYMIEYVYRRIDLVYRNRRPATANDSHTEFTADVLGLNHIPGQSNQWVGDVKVMVISIFMDKSHHR